MSTILLFNGASSSGKSTFITQLIPELHSPWYHYSSDKLVEAGILPAVDRTTRDKPDSWNIIRPRFFDGFHRSIKAFADAGNNLVVEHVVEYQEWYDLLKDLLKDHRMYYIGIHCPLEIMEKRERQRGDRTIGEGRSHLEDGIHSWGVYDLELDTHLSTAEMNIAKVKKLLCKL